MKETEVGRWINIRQNQEEEKTNHCLENITTALLEREKIDKAINWEGMI